MEREPSPENHRFCLPPDTVVEGWRLLGCHGHGAHGVVYRAVLVGQEPSGLVALKLALYPWDPRFMREVALLTLIRHPSVPRLVSHGFWKHPLGTFHPFLVMEWVEGTPLYEWARERAPSSRQVLQVLAQLARALEATHARSAVHRDVKGDNVLVRHADGRAVLMDFGAGNYQAAARVTWNSGPPGTPAYQSPESGLRQLRAVRTPGARHYQAGPEDDLYALGVTAYRLVTGEYPPCPEPFEDEHGTWHLKESPPPDPRRLRPELEPVLGEAIRRMLSLPPKARGTARELAETLEAAAGSAETERTVSARPTRARAGARRTVRSAGLALAVVGVLLAFCAGLAVRVRLEAASPVERVAPGVGEPHESPVDLADLAPAIPLAPVQKPAEPKAIGQGQPPKPIPGQSTPDARGQCPGSKQIPLNGGCWLEQSFSNAAECEQNGCAFFKNRCYAPAMDQRRKPQPTSAPPP